MIVADARAANLNGTSLKGLDAPGMCSAMCFDLGSGPAPTLQTDLRVGAPIATAADEAQGGARRLDAQPSPAEASAKRIAEGSRINWEMAHLEDSFHRIDNTDSLPQKA